jgi:hypothetical protein
VTRRSARQGPWGPFVAPADGTAGAVPRNGAERTGRRRTRRFGPLCTRASRRWGSLEAICVARDTSATIGSAGTGLPHLGAHSRGSIHARRRARRSLCSAHWSSSLSRSMLARLLRACLRTMLSPRLSDHRMPPPCAAASDHRGQRDAVAGSDPEVRIRPNRLGGGHTAPLPQDSIPSLGRALRAGAASFRCRATIHAPERPGVATTTRVCRSGFNVARSTLPHAPDCRRAASSPTTNRLPVWVDGRVGLFKERPVRVHLSGAGMSLTRRLNFSARRPCCA